MTVILAVFGNQSKVSTFGPDNAVYRLAALLAAESPSRPGWGFSFAILSCGGTGMPRYYFHVEGPGHDDHVGDDPNGTDFPPTRRLSTTPNGLFEN